MSPPGKTDASLMSNPSVRLTANISGRRSADQERLQVSFFREPFFREADQGLGQPVILRNENHRFQSLVEWQIFQFGWDRDRPGVCREAFPVEVKTEDVCWCAQGRHTACCPSSAIDSVSQWGAGFPSPSSTGSTDASVMPTGAIVFVNNAAAEPEARSESATKCSPSGWTRNADMPPNDLCVGGQNEAAAEFERAEANLRRIIRLERENRRGVDRDCRPPVPEDPFAG